MHPEIGSLDGMFRNHSKSKIPFSAIFHEQFGKVNMMSISETLLKKHKNGGVEVDSIL